MRSFRLEWNRLFVHRKGWLVVVLFLLLQLAMLVLSDTPENINADRYREDYAVLLQQVEGCWTEEKAAWLEQRSEDTTEAKRTLNTAYEDYYAGRITRTELERAQADLTLLEQEDGFQVLYDQYLYVCEDTRQRFFLETNGWAGLLGSENVDMTLLLVLLLLIVPVLCREYECGMDSLALTMRNGRRTLLLVKPFTAIAAALLVCGGQLVVRWGWYLFRYGLPHGNYPVQSLQAYADCPLAVSLQETFLLTAVCKLFGVGFFALLVLTAAALTRQTSFTALAGAAAMLLPWLGMEQDAVYQLPLPLPFWLAKGFFAEKGTERMLILLAGCGVVLILCGVLLSVRHPSAYRGKHKRRNGHCASVLVILLLIGTLSGCGTASLPTGNFVWNGRTSEELFYGDRHYFYSYDEQTIICESSETEETISILREPTKTLSDTEINGSFFVNDGSLYYTEIERTTNNDTTYIGTGRVSTFRLQCLNLETLVEETVFEHTYLSGLFGMEGGQSSELDRILFLPNPKLFVTGSKLVLIQTKAYVVDLLTGQVSVPKMKTARGVASDGRRLYYVNDRLILCWYDLMTEEYGEFPDVVVSDFSLTAEGVYYLSLRENNQLYVLDPQSGESEPVLEETLESVTWNGRELIVVRQDGTEDVIDKTE